MAGDGDAAPAGIRALRAFAKAPTHMTASSAAREGMCELAYPVREGTSTSSEKSLAQVLDACAETLDRLGPKMRGATVTDVNELAMLHTAAKTLVLRCSPNTTINPMWTNDRVSSNRGVLDTCWLTLLHRRCECEHELVTRRHQAVDELAAVMAHRRDWDSLKTLAQLCAASVAPPGAEGADTAVNNNTRFKEKDLLDVRSAANLAVSLVQVAANENLEMATPGSARAAALTTLSSLADVQMMRMKQGAKGAEGAEGGADTAVRTNEYPEGSRMNEYPREYVASTLIPAAVKAADAAPSGGKGEALRAKLRQTVLRLVGNDSGDDGEAAFGFYLLSTHTALVLGPPGSSRAAVCGSDSSLTNSLAAGLGSDDSKRRKAAIKALTHALGSETAVKRPWLELVATVHAFDDFAAHLNDAARNHIDAVHPSLKGGSNAGSDGSRAEGAVTDEDESAESAPVQMQMPYVYAQSMWTRGLRHANPTVRAGTLRAFCDRDWETHLKRHGGPEPSRVGSLTEEFIARVLLPSAMETPALAGECAKVCELWMRDAVDDVQTADETAASADETPRGTSPGVAFARARCLASALAKLADSTNVAGLDAGCHILAAATSAAISNETARVASSSSVSDGDAFLRDVAAVIEVCGSKRGDPEAQTRQISNAIAAIKNICPATATRCTPGAVRAVLSKVPVHLLDGTSPDGIGCRPGFIALFTEGGDEDFVEDAARRFTRSFLAAGYETQSSTLSSGVEDEATELALMFTLTRGAHATSHLSSIVERVTHEDAGVERRARCLLRSSYRLGSSLANGNVKCDWLQRALRKTLVDDVIPSAMVNLVRGVRAPAGSIPSEAATCLEAVARWRGAEVKTRGNRVSPPGWNFVAADLCDLCVDLSSVDDWDSDDWDSSRYDRVCVRLNALGGVARGLASVSVEATDFEKIGSAISVAIVNLEKVITAVTAASRHEATRVGDARTARWTAAAALLSVPIGKGGGPEKSESLSALASAATVRLLDDALEGLPAVSQNANPGSADEPSHRLLAGLRAVHRLVEVVVPMYPGEPESGLGRKIALAVEKSVKSSRFRKNAPAWAAATACVLHPRLFGSSPRIHSRLEDGSSSCAIDGVGACAWFVAAAVKSGGKSGGSRILRVVSHALSARLVRWPEHARHYAREVWALGLSGEGGFTRAERLAMAQHWHEREVAAEVLTSNGGKNTYGDDAGALADWLEDGGCGGAAGGHVAARVAALSLAHALARAEAPTGSSDGSNNGHSSDCSRKGSRVVSAESYRAAALDGAEALLRHGLNAVSGDDSDLTRDTYRRGSITHRRKVRAWQMLCALTPAIDSLSRVRSAEKVRRLLAKSPMFQSLSKNRGFVRKLGLTPELLPSRQLEYGNGKSGSLPSLPGDTDDEDDEDNSIASALARAAPGAMATHNLPGVRYYAEVFFTLAARSVPSVITDVAIPALRSADVKPAVASSWILVAAGHVVRSKNDKSFSNNASFRSSVEDSLDMARKVLVAVTPWALAHNHSLRVFAQLATHALLEAKASSSSSSLDDTNTEPPVEYSERSVLRSIEALLRTNSEMAKTRVACGPVFDTPLLCAPKDLLAGALDIVSGRRLENTNGGGETGPDAAGFEGAPQSALVSVETFLRTSRESLRSQRAIEDAWLWRDAMASGCDLTGDRITGVVAIGEDDSIVGHGGVSGNGRAGENTNTNTDGGARGGDASSGKSAMSLQKKVEGVGSGLNPESEVYLDGFDSMALALRDMAEDVDRAGIRTDTDTNRRPPGLVVIASLVDKIPNLAGLARTCEVLGAEALVMADRDRTVAHKDFTAVSVTAEQWLPIRDVSIAGLVPYLLRLRREGYTLVGLEQTRGAVDVNDFEFPRKTALVLGREREGIDADVLSVLDTCVVIEQKGMIRSLNVHVSASVAIAAYARAH